MAKINLNNLFERAAGERAPQVDIADSVMAAIDACREPAVVKLNRYLLWVSMGSTATAAAVAFGAFLYWQENGDSVNELLNLVSWVVQ